MKKVFVILLLFVFLLAGWIVYLEIDKRNFIQDLSRQPELSGISSPRMAPLTKTDRGQRKASVDNGHEGTQQEAAPENTFVERTTDSDWWSDDVDLDPTGETVPDPLAGSNMADAGSINNSSQMESKEPFSEAVRKELVERFGNIPQVHTYIDSGRRWRDGTLTPDEDIERLEAQMYLFPNESTRKTLFFQRWLKSHGWEMPQLTEETLEYLRGQGIKVTKTVTGTEVRIDISTE